MVKIAAVRYVNLDRRCRFNKVIATRNLNRRSGLHFPKWIASIQRYDNFFFSVETQLSTADTRVKHSNVSEP